MATATLFGSTGLVGHEVLTTLLASEAFKTAHTISRRAPKTGADNAKLVATVEAETSAWAKKLTETSPPPAVVISAVGTSREAAGSIAAQWKIDHDLNVELAEAAKAAGVRTFVFVSSGGTRGALNGMWPYAKMKVGVEDKIKALDFETGIIFRPGLLLGKREKEMRGNGLLNGLVRGVGKISASWQDALGQEASIIGRAVVAAAALAAEGKAPAKLWVLDASDILRLGRDEWKA